MVPQLGENYLQIFKEGNYSELLDYSQCQLEEDKANEEARYWIIYAHYLMQNYNEGILEAEKFLTEMKNNTWLGRVYNRIGTLYFALGKLNEAYHHYLLAEKLLEDFGTILDFAGVQNNIGLLKDLQGDLNSALSYFQKAVDLKRSTGDEGNEAGTLVNIGMIYYNIGEYENAIRITQEAEKQFRKRDSIPGIAMSIYHLVLNYLEMENLEEAKNQAKRYEEFVDENQEIRTIQISNELIQALILKHTQSLEAKGKAIVQLREYINIENLSIELKLLAMKNLIELKIEEFKLFENDEVLIEINNLIDLMEDIAKHNRMYPLTIDLHILKAKMLQIQGHFVEVKNELYKAESVIEMYSLDHLMMKVQKEYDNFEDTLKRMKEAVDANEKMVKKLEINFLEEYLKSIKL